MLRPPIVMSRGRPVGGPLDVAVVGFAELTRPVTAPPVPPVLVHLIVEGVVYLGERKVSALSGQVDNCQKIGEKLFS